MQNVIVIGSLGRTNSETASPDQRPAPASVCGALAPAVTAANEKFAGDTRGVEAAGSTRKSFCTLAAQLAIAGLELHRVDRPGGMSYFEVRRGREARTCSTLHDVRAVLAAHAGAGA